MGARSKLPYTTVKLSPEANKKLAAIAIHLSKANDCYVSRVQANTRIINEFYVKHKIGKDK